MDQEIKTRWVAALRSGRYTQGQGALRSEDNFCCLGVLCDLVNPEAWEHHETDLVAGFWSHLRSRDEFPAPAVYEQAELGYEQAFALAKLNDDGNPFWTIADFIEEHL